MQTYRIDLSYKGTHYQGWQTQPSRLSIQDKLQSALATFLRGEVQVIGASRTDSGVHAEQQVAIFKTAVKFETHRFLRGINALVPNDIAVHHICAVGDNFHPIRDSLGKLYRYRIWTSDVMSPFAREFSWHCRGLIATELKACAKYLVGVHNFQSFAATDGSAKTFERKLVDIKVLEYDGWIDIYFLGEGFLKQMLRNIVGTMVEAAQGHRESSEIPAILKAQSRQSAGKTAPASGLSLVKIFFDSLPQSISECLPQLQNLSFRILN